MEMGWDKGQVICRDNEIYIWSRGEDLATDKFPELHILKDLFTPGTVLDGEIVCYSNNRIMPFNVLQTRIGRKNLTKNILRDAPVNYIVYDILEYGGVDIREWPQQERRARLESLFEQIGSNDYTRLSPLVQFGSWDELREWHGRSREFVAEGFMLKSKSGTYQVGRKVGGWLKWKVNPLSVDAVLVYAAKGQGRRTELYTDYTFAVWDEEKRLIPFAKAYSGLTDKEIAEVDRFVKQHTLENWSCPHGEARPGFEIGFEGINASTRHKSGIAALSASYAKLAERQTDRGSRYVGVTFVYS
jgi:DNA ligase-1